MPKEPMMPPQIELPATLPDEPPDPLCAPRKKHKGKVSRTDPPPPRNPDRLDSLIGATREQKKRHHNATYWPQDTEPAEDAYGDTVKHKWDLDEFIQGNRNGNMF